MPSIPYKRRADQASKAHPRLTSSSFVSSKPFLVVGPEKGLFYAHGSLLAQVSSVLRMDVEGGMREKHLETIEIQDVDKDIDDETVMRFIEYAYTGDYTVPEPDIVQLPSDSGELEDAFKSSMVPVQEEDVWAPLVDKKSKKDKKKKRAPAVDEDPVRLEPTMDFAFKSPIADAEVALPAQEDPSPAFQSADMNREKLWDSFRHRACVATRSPWQPRSENDEREDYTLVFLCHARLYKFSDRYNCPELMELALQKLRLTLSRHRVYSQRTPDIAELIRYAYAHTMDHKRGRDKLRALVLDFAVCYIRELSRCPSFQKVLEEGGSLPGDLMVNLAPMVL